MGKYDRPGNNAIVISKIKAAILKLRASETPSA